MGVGNHLLLQRIAATDADLKCARFDRLLAGYASSIGELVVTNSEADFADVAGLKIENRTKESSGRKAGVGVRLRSKTPPSYSASNGAE